MNSQSASLSSSLIFLSFFLLISSSTAFDITKILNAYSDFSTFNGYLTQTQVAADINRRETLTVLAVDNSGMSQLSGKSDDVIKKVISLHVILDYYDAAKLQKLSNKTALLTTLFQSSGLAVGQQGFLNVTDTTSGEVSFGSAVKGSSLSSKLVKSVVAQPYNISVLQISSIIIPEGIENSKSPPPPPTAAAPAPAPSKPKSSPPTASPSKAPAKSPPPKSAKAPAPSKDASAPTADAPSNDAADAPSNDAADAPSNDAADAPKLSSPPSPGPEAAAADAPAADNAAAAPASSKKSSGKRVTSGVLVAVFMVVVSSWIAL